MKQLFFILCTALLVSCSGGGNQQGVKFAPQERTSSLSQSEREAAIAQKRAELSGLNIDTLLLSNNIKLTVLSPKPKEEITMRVSEVASQKLMQIACQNGISGLGVSPVFALAMTMESVSKGVTSTIPERKTATYAMNLYVGNVITNDIYASISKQIIGVGDNFEQAALNAVSSIKNSAEYQQMLSQASARIIQWYNKNVPSFKMKVEELISLGEYAQAYGLLTSVPSSATQCFNYAQSRQEVVLKGLKEQRKSENLIAMKNAIAEAGTKYDSKVAGYYQMIPNGCAEKAQADKLYDRYMMSIRNTSDDEINQQSSIEKANIEYQIIQATAAMEANQQAFQQFQEVPSATLAQNVSEEEESSESDSLVDNLLSMALTKVVSISIGYMPEIFDFCISSIL